MRAQSLTVAAFSILAVFAGCSSSPGTAGTTTGTGGSTTTTTTTTTTTGTGGAGGQGTGGTTGTGGSTGTGGATGTGGSTTTTTGGGGSGGGGGACAWSLDQNPCGAGMYCDAPGCGNGTCKPIPNTESGMKDPVCGCDGLSYWSASVAGKHGMSYAQLGACGVSKTCGGFANLKCPAGVSCNYLLPDAASCKGADLSGTCWVMPAVCEPGIGFGPTTRACGEQNCTDACTLIKQEKLYYNDNTCPQ
ncbi:MAG: hypothetical protein U0359_21355 [Byssovorax sp.]